MSLQTAEATEAVQEVAETPVMEIVSGNGVSDDWDNIDEGPSNEKDDSENDGKDKDSDSGDGSESSEEESEQTDIAAEKSETEDSSGEKESNSETGELIEVKVNGEVQEVSLDDLKNNYSGKVAYDKKFSEFDKKEKAWESEIDSVNKYVADLGNTMKNSSVLEGVYQIGELNEIGPHIIKQALIKELLPEINRLVELPEAERMLEYNEADLKYKQEMHNKQQESFSGKQSEAELTSQVKGVMLELKIGDEEWDNAVDHLDTNLEDNEKLTPQLVGEYVEFHRAERRTGDVLKTFNDGEYLKDQEVFETIHDVIMDTPEFTDEEVIEILNESLGKAKQDVVEEKVEKITKRKAPKKKEVKQSESKFTEPEDDDWDDIL